MDGCSRATSTFCIATRDGLVVLDYKTSATHDPAELDRRVEGYRLQGASYALTIAATTDEPVSRVTFLFLTPTGPVERHLTDLVATVERIRALVTAGHEITVEETELTASRGQLTERYTGRRCPRCRR